MFLLYLLLLLFPSFIATTSTANANAKIKEYECESPPLPINNAFNFTEADPSDFPIFYTFLLNTNLRIDTQERMVSLYQSMACMIPAHSSNNQTKFYLLGIGASNNFTNFGTNPRQWLSLLQSNPPKNANNRILSICHQLDDGISKLVNLEGKEALKKGLKNFVMFQMINDLGAEKCETRMEEFLKRNQFTDPIGISQNVITFGARKSSPSTTIINETALQANPRFFPGASTIINGFPDFDNKNMIHATIEPFVNEMLEKSAMFYQFYTKYANNESVARMTEELFNSHDEKVKTVPPSIQTVTLCAVLFALILLAIVIIISSYSTSIFSDNNYIRDRARRLRRHDPESVRLVEVPMENFAESIFGESPRISSPSSSSSSAAAYTSPTDNSIYQTPSPNMVIQIDNDDGLTDIRLHE